MKVAPIRKTTPDCTLFIASRLSSMRRTYSSGSYPSCQILMLPIRGLSYHFNIKLYFKRTINASVNFFTLPVVNVGLSTKVGAVFDFFEVVCINCLFFPVSARCTFGYSHELANKPARGLVFFLGQRNLRWPSSFSLWQMSNCGTRDGTRTRKPFQTADFKSAEVTNFSTLALG